MNENSTAQSMRAAAAHHRAGRLAEARAIYEQILAQEPNHPDALQLLGASCIQIGDLDAAIELIQRAIAINPGVADYHNNLGYAFRKKGQLDQAIAVWRQAIGLRPNFAEAYNNLADALRDQGRFDEAILAWGETVRIKPDAAQALNSLAAALAAKGSLDQAIATYRQGIRIRPDWAVIHCNLGNALAAQGQFDDAIASYQEAIRLKPELAEAHCNKGITLKDHGRLKEAILSFRKAIEIKPDVADAYMNLGVALHEIGQPDEAITAYRQALRLKPDYVEAYGNLGNTLRFMGQIDEAIAVLRHALRLQPDCAEAHSNLVFTLHSHPAYDAKMLYEENRRWNQRHAEPLEKFIQPHDNSPDPDRQLRIGYVSSDFRNHPVGRFLLPLMSSHDHAGFKIFCYANQLRADGITEILRRHADHWRTTVGMTHDRMAQLIREDQIDVLVDLSMHTAGNRLLVFARKPAPVQVTYLAYCSTTGLEAMDYRFTDPYLDPPGMDESVYSERSMRLPQTYWCYPLQDQSSEVGPLPALSGDEVTFGCLNSFGKISPETVNLWIEVLHAVPKSRLLVHAHEGSHRQRMLDRLEKGGIHPRRLSFVGKLGWSQYFKKYQEIDIGLDPFPYNGGTTTCDALLMGVPVITLRGRTAVGRAGVSILSNVRLTDWIADIPEQYISIAQQMAGDLPRLVEVRSTLRRRMRASPLMNAKQFARDVEAAFRRMWMNWCSKQPGQK